MADWFVASPQSLLAVVLSTLGVYVALVVLVRLVGLRSFSKMTSVDFALTITTGAVLASTLLNQSPPLLQGVVALAALFALQAAASWGRRHGLSVLDNEPLVLMAGAEVLEDNLKRAGVTKADLRGKLREANVLTLDQVRAVVFETTGDISVLHGDPDGPALEAGLLRGVRDADRVATVERDGRGGG
ncbi:DUF421 domain-containing protein [Rubrivirga sp. S365]|uniref:DUF421 domain-containing protein n=1 Tax=Rubrivirga sp. S365 TaxID=3076080 RepID=UPI0028CA09E8|nr:YetF domain-containing protein [Rubrivirga sp. S365]MDT7856563.1 DUF421 domain-containing protein [Rubrivirga sp. S365]